MTAYHYWQNQPGCSPNDYRALPTRAPIVSRLTSSTHRSTTCESDVRFSRTPNKTLHN